MQSIYGIIYCKCCNTFDKNISSLSYHNNIWHINNLNYTQYYTFIYSIPNPDINLFFNTHYISSSDLNNYYICSKCLQSIINSHSDFSNGNLTLLYK